MAKNNLIELGLVPAAKRKRIILIMVWSLFIFIIGLVAIIDASRYIPLWFQVHDKFAHAVIFFWFFVYTRMLFPRWSAWSTIVFLLCLGILTELMQLLFTNGQRRFDFIDIIWNIYGILAAWLVLGFWRWCRKSRETL